MIELTPETILIKNFKIPINISLRATDIDENDIVLIGYDFSKIFNYSITNQAISNRDKTALITIYPEQIDVIQQFNNLIFKYTTNFNYY